MHYTTICNTQSTAPEDGRNHRPKHVELIGIINKPLLLHLVVCLYYCNITVFTYSSIVHSKLSVLHVILAATVSRKYPENKGPKAVQLT